MSDRLVQVLDFVATGQPVSDAHSLLERLGAFETVAHERRVAAAAVRLAQRFGGNRRQAEVAAWLHDISAVIPTHQRVAACRELGVSLLPVEEEHPVLAHGKLSRAFAELVVKVDDPRILDAIQYHTTLRRRATPLDKVVFLADKLECDAPDLLKEFGALVRAGAEQSMDAGCLAYLDYVVDNAARLGWPLHPHLLAAHQELTFLAAAAPPPPRTRPPRRSASSPTQRSKPPSRPRFNITGPLTPRDSS